MMKGKNLFWILTIIAVILIVGGFVFHHLRNRPFARMGYYVQNSNGTLQGIGRHFVKSGMLEVEFYYKTRGGTQHITYTLQKDGIKKPILERALFTTISGGNTLGSPQWASVGFPVAHYPNDLKLSVGKYYVLLYINGIQVDSVTFYVDQPMVAYADTAQHQ